MACTVQPCHGTVKDHMGNAEAAESFFSFEHKLTNQFLCWVYLEEINHFDTYQQQDVLYQRSATKGKASETNTTDDLINTRAADLKSWRQLTSQLRMHSIRQIREHDHIAQIRRVFLSPSNIFDNELPPRISYEPFEVGTLASCFQSQESELSGYEPLQICSDVAEGLSALHQHGIAHNDVQCEIILLFRSGEDKQRLSAKLAGFGSISFLSGARMPTPWAAAPELFAPKSSDDEGSIELGGTVDSSCLQGPKGTWHDLYSLGLLCWAVHLRSANPFLHYLFEEAELTPSQTAARHWAQVSLQSNGSVTNLQAASERTQSPSRLSGTDLRAVQSLKSDPNDRLLRVIKQTFKGSEATDSSNYLQKAVSRLCLHNPKSRSLGAAMAALQGTHKFFSSTHENQDKREASVWENGWMLSLQPESRLTSFNQHLAIRGTTSSLLSDSLKLEESSLQRLYKGIVHLRKQHSTVVFKQSDILEVCRFLDSLIEVTERNKQSDVAITAREAALALFELRMDRLGSTTAADMQEKSLSALSKAMVLENKWDLYPLGTSVYHRFGRALEGKIVSPGCLRGVALGSEHGERMLYELQGQFLPLADCEASLHRLLAQSSNSKVEIPKENFIRALIRLASKRTWRKNPLLTETLDDQGTTALHYAARARLLPVAKCLVTDMSFDIHVVDSLLNTPLHYAVWVGDRAMIEFLVQHGASPLKKNFLGQLPVHLVFNVPPADMERVMQCLCKIPSAGCDAMKSLVLTGFGTHGVDTSSSEKTTLILQAIAFRRSDIVCQLLSMAPNLLEDDSSVGVLEQAFRHQMAYQLITPAMSPHILQTMVNPWKLLGLALEAKPDRRILWHGKNYKKELVWLFEFVLSYFHEGLVSHTPEKLFYQALRMSNTDILPTIRDWKDVLPVDVEDVLRPGVQGSFRISCLYGDMRDNGGTLRRMWAWLDDTQRQDILNNPETSDALLASAVARSSSGAKNRYKAVRWLLKRGFRLQPVGFIEVLKARDRKCATLLFPTMETDVFDLATRVIDEAVRAGGCRLLQDFVAIANHTRRVRTGKAPPIEKLMVMDEREDKTVARKYYLLDHFSRSPAYANPLSDPISHKNFQDVARFLCTLFQSVPSGSSSSDIVSLDFALFSWRAHVVDIFLEFASDETLLSLAELWWMTPKFAEAGLEILEYIRHDKTLLPSSSPPSMDRDSPPPFRHLFHTPLDFQAERADRRGRIAAMTNVIKKHVKMRSGRVKTQPLSVTCWGLVLDKIRRLDARHWPRNESYDDIFSDFCASISGGELIAELQVLKPALHVLERSIGVHNGKSRDSTHSGSAFDARRDRGQFFGLSRKEMLVAVFGALLSSPTSLSPSDSLLSLFGLSHTPFNSARERWHTTVDHLLLLCPKDETKNRNTPKHDGWARSEMRMEVFLRLIAATPAKSPKAISEPHTPDPPPASNTPATRLPVFIKGGQKLRRASNLAGGHTAYIRIDLAEALDIEAALRDEVQSYASHS